MTRFNLNVAKTFIGKNVNLYLTDGSVIVNVRILNVKRARGKEGKACIQCLTPRRKKPFKIQLKDVVWAEPLNPYLFAEQS